MRRSSTSGACCAPQVGRSAMLRRAEHGLLELRLALELMEMRSPPAQPRGCSHLRLLGVRCGRQHLPLSPPLGLRDHSHTHDPSSAKVNPEGERHCPDQRGPILCRLREPQSSYDALRASSLSICSLSKPTIQRLPILITGTPVCPVLRTISRAASASRSTLISLNGTPRSLR